jgi:hypothetical protein
MWINNSIAKPLRNGRYKTLVEWDGLGNLGEAEDQLFENGDWCHFESSRQFIRYWWAEKEDYKTISNELEKEMENYEK